MIHTGNMFKPVPQGNMEDLQSQHRKKGFFARLFD